ncbi:MAG: hypothetical protein ACYDH6_12510 [Acidimicrobiales bacterium]
MDVLRRAVDCAIDRVTARWRAPDGIVLRHAPSGRVLTSVDADPIEFEDAASAEEFGRRFLDEVDAWEIVRADAVCRAA